MGDSSVGELVCKLSKGCFSDMDFGNHHVVGRCLGCIAAQKLSLGELPRGQLPFGVSHAALSNSRDSLLQVGLHQEKGRHCQCPFLLWVVAAS